MAIEFKSFVIQRLVIKDYPHFCICWIILCNKMQTLFFSNMFLKQFKILRLSLGADSRSMQLIFCFDLPNFVLTGRFHAVKKRPTQQLKWKVSSILLELIATASKTASQYCFVTKIWSSRHHSDSALDLPLFSEEFS